MNALDGQPASRRTVLRAGLSALACSALALAGCGSQAAPGAGPSGNSSSSPQSWDGLVAAAKREGKVVVHGPPDPAARQDLPARFKDRFGIDVEYDGGNSAEFVSRLQSERLANQYNVDVMITGADPAHPVLLSSGWLDAIKPALLLPEVTDGSKWKTGQPWFRDPDGQYLLQLFNSVQPTLTINTGIVQPGDIPAADSLLDTKWKGKIAAFDPSAAGIGLAIASALYVAKGEDFCSKLYLGQSVVLTRDYAQGADWLAHGAYPVGLAVAQNYLGPYKKGGVTFATLDLPDAANAVGGGFGVVSLMNHAPHPNAARVFVNWIASQEGVTVYSKDEGQVPVRTDVDATWVDASLVPKPGIHYLDTYDHDFVVNQRTKIGDFFRKLLK
jgi:iron(III) transport system substrate-binding protein